MTDYVLPENLAEQLQHFAELENRSVNEVLEKMIATYKPEIEQLDTAPNPFLIMLEMAEEANLPFSEDNITERSRKILNTEYADYLLKRMHGDDAT